MNRQIEEREWTHNHEQERLSRSPHKPHRTTSNGNGNNSPSGRHRDRLRRENENDVFEESVRGTSAPPFGRINGALRNFRHPDSESDNDDNTAEDRMHHRSNSNLYFSYPVDSCDNVRNNNRHNHHNHDLADDEEEPNDVVVFSSRPSRSRPVRSLSDSEDRYSLPSRGATAVRSRSVKSFKRDNNSNSNLSNPDPDTDTDNAENHLLTVAQQLELIKSTQDCILSELTDNISNIQNENVQIKNTNEHLTMQNSHLLKLVSDLSKEVEQVREVCRTHGWPLDKEQEKRQSQKNPQAEETNDFGEAVHDEDDPDPPKQRRRSSSRDRQSRESTNEHDHQHQFQPHPQSKPPISPRNKNKLPEENPERIEKVSSKQRSHRKKPLTSEEVKVKARTSKNKLAIESSDHEYDVENEKPRSRHRSKDQRKQSSSKLSSNDSINKRKMSSTSSSKTLVEKRSSKTKTKGKGKEASIPPEEDDDDSCFRKLFRKKKKKVSKDSLSRSGAEERIR